MNQSFWTYELTPCNISPSDAGILHRFLLKVTFAKSLCAKSFRMMRKVLINLGVVTALLLCSMNNSQADGSFQSSFGASIAYQDTEGLTKPAVVLIHGFPVNHEMWNFQITALRESFRVITYDLRGLGQSKTQDTHYTLEILVDDFFALLDHLKIERASIVGFSMGGYIALRAIERDASRFQALVLADTQSASDSNEAKIKRTLAMKTIKAKPNGLHEYGQKFIPTTLSAKTLRENPKVADQLTQMIESNTEAGVSGGLLALLSRTDTTATLPRIQVPTLILVGEEDTITPPHVAQTMKEQIPESRLKSLSDAGHFSPLENPKEFNSTLLSFLKEVRSNVSQRTE
jgi:pimeloyl-ACP methyl ester carboxylesterase